MKTVIQTWTMNIKSFFYFKSFPSSCLCHLPLNSILLKVNCLTNCIHQEKLHNSVERTSNIHSFNLPDPNRISFPVLAETCYSQRSCKRSLSLLFFWLESFSQFLEKNTRLLWKKSRRFLIISLTFLDLSCCLLFFKCSGQDDVLAKSNAKQSQRSTLCILWTI